MLLTNYLSFIWPSLSLHGPSKDNLERFEVPTTSRQKYLSMGTRKRWGPRVLRIRRNRGIYIWFTFPGLRPVHTNANAIRMLKSQIRNELRTKLKCVQLSCEYRSEKRGCDIKFTSNSCRIRRKYPGFRGQHWPFWFKYRFNLKSHWSSL